MRPALSGVWNTRPETVQAAADGRTRERATLLALRRSAQDADADMERRIADWLALPLDERRRRIAAQKATLR